MDQSRQFLQLLSISRLEVIVGIVIAVVIAVLLAVPSLYESSDIKAYFSYIENNPTEVQSEYAQLSNKVNTSKFAADASVFGLWSLAGLVGYAIVSSAVKVFSQLKQFREELDYTNTNKQAIIFEAFIKLGVRLLSAGALYVLVLVFFTLIAPLLLIQLRQVQPQDYVSMVGVGALIIVATLLFVHIFTVLVRLVVLRTRLFYSRA